MSGSDFDVGSEMVKALSAAVSFVIALSLNNALQKTFELIPVGKGLLGSWIYAIVSLGLGLLLLWVLASYVQPAVSRKD